MTLYRVTLPYLVAGFYADSFDRIITVAPVLSWMRGKSVAQIRTWLAGKGGVLERLNVV